jgi:ATP-dependent RNA helicase DeaD
MGLRSEVEQILVRTPSTRQTALFSATLPDPIRAMVGRYLRNPIWVTPGSGNGALFHDAPRRNPRTAVS